MCRVRRSAVRAGGQPSTSARRPRPGYRTPRSRGRPDRRGAASLLQGPSLLAGLARLRLQPGRQLVDEGIELARPFRNPERRGRRSRPQVLADRVPRQPRPPCNLPNKKADPAMPIVRSRSVTPCRSLRCPRFSSQGTFEHGSHLSGNLPAARVSSQCKSTPAPPFASDLGATDHRREHPPAGYRCSSGWPVRG